MFELLSAYRLTPKDLIPLRIAHEAFLLDPFSLAVDWFLAAMLQPLTLSDPVRLAKMLACTKSASDLFNSIEGLFQLPFPAFTLEAPVLT